MSDQNLYLNRLSFPSRLNTGVVASYLRNFRLTLLLLIFILIGGIVSFFNLPQRLNPPINIPIVTVATVLPGASPQDIETLLTIPLEDQINTVKGVDTITSTSQDNMSLIQVQFLSNIDIKQAESDVKSAVDKVSSLPADALDPSVKALDFEDQPIWTFALGTHEELPTLMREADKLEKAISKSQKVDRVVTSGYEIQEVQVVLSPEKMREYGINAQSLAQSIKRAANSFPLGSVNTENNTFSVTINPEIETLQDIRDIRLTVHNTTVRLGEIAEVSEKPKANQTKSFLASNKDTAKRVVHFSVYKTRDADINQTSDEVKKIVDDELKTTDNRFTLTTILNTSDMIRTQFTDLLGEFQSTIILVFICLFLFIGLRQAIISAITIPLTFLSSFIFMSMVGMSINFLTLFAFLLSLGLLVDDTIVIVSAMTTYFKTGKFTIKETGLLVWRDFIVPIWSTTITTIWAFVPLLLASGIIGEFIKPIPIVISIVMISSTAIAVLITLPLMMIILRPQFPDRVKTLFRILFFIVAVAVIILISPKNILLPFIIVAYFAVLGIMITIRSIVKERTQTVIAGNKPASRVAGVIKKYMDKPVLNIEVVSHAYYRLINRILEKRSSRRKVVAAIIIFALVSYALVPLGFVKNEFFPKTDEDYVYVNIEYPAGTNTETLTTEALQMLDTLRKTKETQFVSMEIGHAAGNSFSGGGNQSTVSYTFHLLPKHDRKTTSMDIAQELRNKLENYGKGTVSVVEESGGPPAGSDLQIELFGDDLNTVDSYANKLMDYLKSRPGVTNVSKSLKPGTSQIVFVPNQEEMTKAGVTSDVIGFTIRTFTSGMELDSIKFKGNGNDEEKVMLIVGNSTKTMEELNQITIPAGRNSLPITSLGSFETQQSPTQISRSDRKRTITVSAGIQAGQANVTEEGQKLEQFATDKLNLPDGYAWQTGGVNEENAKSIQSIIQAMGVAFLLILVTMVIQFGSFRQAFIALIVIPLAVSSVFFVFALTGTPLSFPALIGVLALFGIIVTNSMFIIDKINLNKREGLPFKEAIADAGASRLEPIVLTKLCTVLGLLPITLAEPLWRGLGGAIIAGVLLASTFMLLFIPVVYYSLFVKEETASATSQ